MTDLATLVVKLEAETSQYRRELQVATAQIQKFSSDTSSALTGIAKNFLGLLAGEEILRFTDGIIKSMAHLVDFSKAIGITTESLSGLQYASKLQGVEDISPAFVKLAKATGQAAEGNTKLQAAFKAVGVEIKTAAGEIKPADQLFLEISDSFKNHADSTEKAAIALQLFSRGGAEFIAFLDQGSEAIKRQEEEAKLLGAIISGPTAEAAHEFENNVIRLKTAFIGLVDQALAKVLPQMVSLTDDAVAFAKEAKGSTQAVDQFAAGLKTLVTVAVGVGTALEVVGKTIGAMLALTATLREIPDAVQFAMHPVDSYKKAQQVVSEAKSIIKDAYGDISGTVSAAITKVNKLWTDTGTAVDQAGAAAEKAKPKFVLPDLAANTAMEHAIEQLEKYKATLQDQVETYGLGTAAAVRFSVEQGKLSLEIAKAGEKGKELGKEIITLAERYEALRNQDAIAHIDIQIQQLTGHTMEAAAAAFDLSNRALKASLISVDNQEGLKQLEILRQLSLEQAKFNEQQTIANKDQGELSLQLALINKARTEGRITDLDAQQQEEAARAQTIAQLEKVYEEMKKVAEASGDPRLIDNAQRFKESIIALQVQTNVLANKLRTDFTDAASNAFSDFVTGAKSAGDAFLSFITSIEKELVNLAAKQLFQKIFTTSGSEGGSSGLFNWLAGALSSSGGGGAAGGSAADLSGLGGEAGGPVAPAGGKAMKVGEAGPELYVPDVGATPAASITAGGTRLPDTIPEAARILGPGRFVVPAPGVIIPHQKLVSALAAPERLEIVAGPLAGLSEALQALFAGSPAPRAPAGAPERARGLAGGLLDPREYEKLLTDRYLEKRAGGGPVSGGKPYLVGEHGPELYVPDTSGSIQSADKRWGGGGATIHNHFMIQAPQGMVSKSTQVQIAAAAARSLQTAGLRNN